MAGDFLTALSLLRMHPEAMVFDDGTTLCSGSEVLLPYPSWVSPVLKAAVILVFLALLLFGRIEVVVENG